MKTRTRLLSWLPLLVVTVVAMPCLADEVVLKSGGTLLGKAYREAGQVRVELEEGVLVFPESVVERIVPGISPAEIKAAERATRLEWLKLRLDQTGLGDAQALYRIAEDARLARFPEDELRGVLGLVLGVDPDHAGAREDLGEVRYGDRWVMRDEAQRLAEQDRATDLRSRGFVLYHGEWLLPDEIDWREWERKWQEAIRDAEAERDDAIEARDDAESERDAARRETDGLAARLASLEADEAHQRATIADLESEVRRLEHERDALRHELHACRQELASVPRRVDDDSH